MHLFIYWTRVYWYQWVWWKYVIIHNIHVPVSSICIAASKLGSGCSTSTCACTPNRGSAATSRNGLSEARAFSGFEQTNCCKLMNRTETNGVQGTWLKAFKGETFGTSVLSYIHRYWEGIVLLCLPSDSVVFKLSVSGCCRVVQVSPGSILTSDFTVSSILG